MARAVVALGGNAILPKDAAYTADQELQAIRDTVDNLVSLLNEYDVAMTHGNGPQVGELLLQQRYGESAMPLDVLVAETQAQIGYLLQQALGNADVDATTVVTQVRVDQDDPAFDTATKPVGPYYTEAEAQEKPFETKQVGTGETAWRRVVPSPAPQNIVEQDAITTLLDAGTVPICVGGGGAPVVKQDEQLAGVEAVIDKDRASALLATTLDADLLVILTNVEYAYRHYSTEDEEPIEAATPDELDALLAEGAFGEGSMQPKVAACMNFVRDSGERAIITTPDSVEDALAGDTGTQVRP